MWVNAEPLLRPSSPIKGTLKGALIDLTTLGAVRAALMSRPTRRTRFRALVKTANLAKGPTDRASESWREVTDELTAAQGDQRELDHTQLSLTQLINVSMMDQDHPPA